MIHLGTTGKLATTLLLAATLTGCIDMTVDVAVTSETTAKSTMTQVMGADFYAMIKMSAEQGGTNAAEDDFCADGALTENADGSATCVTVEEGRFADLKMGEDEAAVVFSSAGPGLVRVALPAEEMQGQVGAEEDMDAETKAMMEAFLTGHAITVRFSGTEITETNMTLSADGTSAEHVIPFLDLMNGTADLPDELYAIVRAP